MRICSTESELLTDRDRALLDAHAEAHGVREALKIDERYKELYAQRYKGDAQGLEDALKAETRAQMLGRRMAGESYGAQANGVLDRVIRFLRQVRELLAGRGFRDVQDVFEQFDRGGYTRKPSAGEGRFAMPGGYELTGDEKRYVAAWGEHALTAHDIVKQKARLGGLEADLNGGDAKAAQQARRRVGLMDEKAKQLAATYGQNEHPGYDPVKAVTADLAQRTAALKQALEAKDWDAFKAATGEVESSMDRFEAYTRQEDARQAPQPGAQAAPGKPDWVEDYAKASEEGKLGAAVDKAAANIEKVVRGSLAKGEIKQETAEEVLKMWRDFRRETGSALEASQRTAKVLTEEDKLRKRQALKQQECQQNCESFTMKFRDALGQPDPVRALEFLHDNIGHFAFPAGMQDVVGRAKSVEGLAIKKMMEMLDYFHPNKLGGLGEKRRMVLDKVIRELKGEETGDVLAKRFAKAWEEVHEELRQRFNAAGGNIAKLEHWGLSQVHDRRAMIMAGKEKWINYIWPRLDLEKTVHALTRLPMTDRELRDSLSHIYDEVVSDGWNERKISAQREHWCACQSARRPPFPAFQEC